MAMTINEMLEKRARLWESTKKFLEDHIDKDGKMAAADAEAYEKMEADIKEMSKTIDRLNKQQEVRIADFQSADRQTADRNAGYSRKEGYGIRCLQESDADGTAYQLP